MDNDPDFSGLRRLPLPTLKERRRRMQELLNEERKVLNELVQGGARGSVVIKKKREIKRILAGIKYLGSPDPRLDLYRIFDQPLPQDQLGLPLPKPKGD